MWCAGEVTGIVNESVLRPTFMAVCGGEVSDRQIQEANDRFLSDPHYQQLAQEVAAQGRPTGQLTEAYRQWLSVPGNCPTENFGNSIRETAMNVIMAPRAEDRYATWNSLFTQYIDLMSLLLSAVSETEEVSPEFQSAILLAANRLDIIATKIDIISGIFTGQSFDTDKIIAAQNAAIQDMRRAISQTIDIMSAGMLEGFELDSAIEDVRKILNDAWTIFNDPFYYVYLLGEQLAAKPANIRFTLGVFDLSLGVFDNVPILKPEDPGRLREIINGVLTALSQYGTKNDPVELEFSWDQKAGALLININSNNPLLIFDPPWDQLKEKLGQSSFSYQQTSMFGHTIAIPVPLSEAPVSSTSGGGGSGSSSPVSGSGFENGGSSGEAMAASAEEITSIDDVLEVTEDEYYNDAQGGIDDYEDVDQFFATTPIETGAAFFAECLP